MTSIFEKRKQENKTAITIALILLTAFAAFSASIPFTGAREIEAETITLLMVAPNPIGVGQQALVSFRINRYTPGTTITTNLLTGFRVNITKPDGTVEQKGPYQADATGGTWFAFVPTKVGNYSLQASFPGNWVNTTYQGAPQNVFYGASVSDVVNLVVQQEPVPHYPSQPFPTDYWTRPIYGENKDWYRYTSQWLMTRGRYGSWYQPDSSSPNSAHVLWKKPVWFGGIPGGSTYGDKVYYTGLAYEQPYEPLIFNGRIYYAEHSSTRITPFGTKVLDLYTGEEIMYLDGVGINAAQNLDIENVNEHGVLPYLWEMQTGNNATWRMFDAFTGKHLLSITNLTAQSLPQYGGVSNMGSGTFGPNGEILWYTISGRSTTTNRYLTMWNTSRAIAGPQGNIYWNPNVGQVFDGRNAIEWNVSIPDVGRQQTIETVTPDYVFLRFSDYQRFPQEYIDSAYPAKLKKDASGNYPASIQALWVQNRTDIYRPGQRPSYIGNEGIYTFFATNTMKLHAYSMQTGLQVWETEPLSGWGVFNVIGMSANGIAYQTGYDGHVRAYNSANGNLIWDYYLGNSGLETAYGNYPVNNALTVSGDGKLFVATDEHTPDAVMWRGGKIFAVDAFSGKPVWNISGNLRLPSIADGYLTAVNQYDNQIYTFGKGPSKTTVSAPLTSVPLGQSFMIAGSVTDQSPGQKDTPAISDIDMSAWMEYLHMQKTKPANAKGVQVTLVAVDSNGGVTELGTTTSDVYGSYGLSWTPQTKGTYQIIANFAGTNSYGSSSASTYITVDSATASAQPTPTPASPTPPPTATSTPSPSPSQPVNPTGGVNTALYVAIAAVAIIAIVVTVAVILKRRK
jgi:hypothetical protein